MKKESTKEAIAKKKKNTKAICYVSLVILVILLLLPPVLRLLNTSGDGGNKKSKEDKKEGVVLSCEKAEESISSTFLNGEPQSILYKVKGNYSDTSITNPDEEYYPDPIEGADNTETDGVSSSVDSGEVTDNNSIEPTEQPIENSMVNDKPVLTLLRPYSSIEYNEEAGITSFRVYVPDLRDKDFYQSYLKTVESQEAYFKSHNFSCSKTTV